jgi:hypothetical protein
MDGTLIYAKTPKGVAEVAARSAQVPMTARRVLIMMDGKRTVDELSQLVRPGEIDAIIGQLEAGGLIVRTNTSVPLDVPTINGRESDNELPASAGAVMDDRDNAFTLDEAKRRASRELNDRLGPDAEQMAIRIEQCRTIEQFRERVREAERFVAAALGPAAAQEYLRALRRRP